MHARERGQNIQEENMKNRLGWKEENIYRPSEERNNDNTQKESLRGKNCRVSKRKTKLPTSRGTQRYRRAKNIKAK